MEECIRMILILIWAYWIFESISEAMTWKSSWWSTYKINPKTYHLIRLPETLSIMISHLILSYLLYGWLGVLLGSLCEISGCILYERFYCLKAYNNFFHQKTSKWLSIPHPKIWMEVVLFVISLILIIVIGV